MPKLLPGADFEWFDVDTDDFSLKYDTDSETGCTLDVDLAHPKELHDKHNDYPLAAELMKVAADMLSSHSREICAKYNSQHKNVRDGQTENWLQT